MKSSLQKQIDHLIDLHLDSKDTSKVSLSFIPKHFILACLPHKDVGDVGSWGKNVNNLSLLIESGSFLRDNKAINIGIPYGSIPRLILIWITTEAVRKKNREINLGKSFIGFLKAIGFKAYGGGKNGPMNRVYQQMLRFFSSRISFTILSKNAVYRENYGIADQFYLWTSSNFDDKKLKGKIVLDEVFFNYLLSNPVPLNWEMILSLKQSPLAIDLFIWLCYKAATLNSPQKFHWETLHNQFGSDFSCIRSFKYKIKKHLERILILYPELNITLNSRFIEINPSPSLIKSRM